MAHASEILGNKSSSNLIQRKEAGLLSLCWETHARNVQGREEVGAGTRNLSSRHCWAPYSDLEFVLPLSGPQYPHMQNDLGLLKVHCDFMFQD